MSSQRKNAELYSATRSTEASLARKKLRTAVDNAGAPIRVKTLPHNGNCNEQKDGRYDQEIMIELRGFQKLRVRDS